MKKRMTMHLGGLGGGSGGRMGGRMGGGFEPSTSRVSSNTELVSPFASGNGSSFSLYLEPMLNSYWKSYMQVITLNTRPDGVLRDLVMSVNFPKLSPFQESSNSPYYTGSNCVLCLMRYPVSAIGGSGAAFRMGDAFMGADDIPSVLSFLEINGYTVQIALTNMLFEGEVPVGGVSESRLSGNRKLIAMVRSNTIR
jgi:hypothetical protein